MAGDEIPRVSAVTLSCTTKINVGILYMVFGLLWG
jgi:hypothetical protein